jgi:hypothetical protein
MALAQDIIASISEAGYSTIKSQPDDQSSVENPGTPQAKTLELVQNNENVSYLQSLMMKC